MAKPIDDVPQRALVFELKKAIDKDDTVAMRNIARNNPHSTFSKYVLKNIGPARERRLMHALAREALPVPTEAARRVVAGGEHGEEQAPQVHPEEG